MTTLYLARGGDGKALAPALLARLLDEQYGPPVPTVARLPGGKPWLPDRPEIHISISHSGGIALCGAGDAPLGVDVEMVRPRSAALTRRTLSPRELAWLQTGGSRWEDFYDLWTRKEALCKCTGEGLRRHPRTLEVTLPGAGEGSAQAGFFFWGWAGADWRASACVRGEGPVRLELVDLPSDLDGTK